MRSSLWLASAAALLLCCLILSLTASPTLASQPDAFENELAAEAPELVEHSADSFLKLNELSGDEGEITPETSFAELESEHQQMIQEAESEGDAAEDNESEEETNEEEEQPSLMELSSESDTDSDAENESEGSGSGRKRVVQKQRAVKRAVKRAVQQKRVVQPWHRDLKNQPVARSGDKPIECLDGDCTRAIGVKKAAVGTHPNANTAPPPTKLDIALGAVKEEIMVRAKELHLEKDWSKKVGTLIDEYQQKLQKVTNNIVNLRVQTKALLRKKKQIQNVQVQNKLRDKLKAAQADLNRLQKQMEHIAGKENEFTDTERQLKGTMNALKNSLLKLRGQETKKLLAEGIDLPLP